MGSDAVLALGDLQYECGGLSAFNQFYESSWGRFKSITRPAAGNHEYMSSGGMDCDATGSGAGYFSYFGAAAGESATGYYSYDIGSWHLIALNSNCSKVGGCAAGSAQLAWLQQDLAEHPQDCTIAYWHHPRWSSGVRHGSNAAYSAFWRVLYEGGADVVLSGHEHNYERFAPQNPAGERDDATGIVEFVVGTGGKFLYEPGTPLANSLVRQGHTFGVLKLTLHSTGYDWEFVAEAGSTFADSGSASCHGNVVPPVAMGQPLLLGTAREGQTITSGTGDWAGTQPITYAYAWDRCDTAGANCVPIEGRTEPTYVLTSADIGSRVRARVTATNAAGKREAAARPTSVVQAAPPVSTALPVVSGTARDGETLTTSDGTWTGTPPITFTYQWRRCDSGGNNCLSIDGATQQSYQLSPADVGSTIRARVIATNQGGYAYRSSAQTAVVRGIAPVNTALPVVSGTARDGETLTTSDGTWTGTPPITFTYQWRRCDSGGNNCLSIDGATQQSYQLSPADVGTTMTVLVTAANAVGVGTAVSQPTTAVRALPPASTGRPVISGTTREGETLTTSDGTWTGTPPITYTYQWRRCDVGGNECVLIPGATASSYALAFADVGATLRSRVTATNAAGYTYRSSEPTAVVASATPDTTPPTVSLTAPVEGSIVSGTVTLSAVASDNVAVNQVKWFVDDVEVAWDGNGEPWTKTWNSASVSDGEHRIVARAADPAGNWATSQLVTVNVANSTPAAAPQQARIIRRSVRALVGWLEHVFDRR